MALSDSSVLEHSFQEILQLAERTRPAPVVRGCLCPPDQGLSLAQGRLATVALPAQKVAARRLVRFVEFVQLKLAARGWGGVGVQLEVRSRSVVPTNHIR